MEDKFYWLALNLVPGIKSVSLKRLYEAFGDAKDIFKTQVSHLRQIQGISDKLAERISSFDIEGKVKREIDIMATQGISFLTFREKAYPELLKHIYDPPVVLYIKGGFSLYDNISIAVVGSRSPTLYGKTVAQNLAAKLAASSVTVVSGMARGIDTMAHRGAIRANGRTIAVLGSSLDCIYPSENKGLANKIQSNGAVISEFPMGTGPFKYNFPIRNRIISGLSLGTLVVEAGERSGALITARLALEQGREVFAVPGPINSWASKGSNGLIKQGAKLVEDIEDILTELPHFVKSALCNGHQTKNNNNQDKSGLKDNGENMILKNFDKEPLHIDVLIKKTGIPANRLLPVLLKLEIQGMVKQLPGNIFIKL